MILSNTAIFEALDDGRLRIDPEPAPRLEEPGGSESPFDRTAVDLHLGRFLSIPRPASKVVIDLERPGGVGQTLEALTDTVELGPGGWVLDPKHFVLGQTLETVHLRLPHELDRRAAGKPLLAARVEGKSSLARFGLLVHFTAPTIQAGFHGPITLEIMCLGEWPLWLKPGTPVCQLILEHVDGVPDSRSGQFDGRATPTGGR